MRVGAFPHFACNSRCNQPDWPTLSAHQGSAWLARDTTLTRAEPVQHDERELDRDLRKRLDAALAQINSILLGKQHQVRLAFACLLAGGHLLVEDVPGVGKTTLAHAMSATFDLVFQRIQFTSDLLPSDIVGVSVYERETGTFRFHPGPV